MKVVKFEPKIYITTEINNEITRVVNRFSNLSVEFEPAYPMTVKTLKCMINGYIFFNYYTPFALTIVNGDVLRLRIEDIILVIIADMDLLHENL